MCLWQLFLSILNCLIWIDLRWSIFFCTWICIIENGVWGLYYSVKFSIISLLYYEVVLIWEMYNFERFYRLFVFVGIYVYLFIQYKCFYQLFCTTISWSWTMSRFLKNNFWTFSVSFPVIYVLRNTFEWSKKNCQ